MAGNAIGAAKATAARVKKRAAQRKEARRQSYVEYLGREPEPEPAPPVTAATVEPQPEPDSVPNSAPIVPAMVAPAVQRMNAAGNRVLVHSTLNVAAVDAATHLANVVRRGRVPHLVRFQAAVKVLELAGINGKQPQQPRDDDAGMAAILDRVATALAMRKAAATATDAAVIGEETVRADTPQQSQQQPD